MRIIIYNKDHYTEKCNSENLNIGEMMMINDERAGLDWNNKIILKTFDNFILLEDPETAWEEDLEINGYKMPKGAAITLVNE